MVSQIAFVGVSLAYAVFIWKVLFLKFDVALPSVVVLEIFCLIPAVLEIWWFFVILACVRYFRSDERLQIMAESDLGNLTLRSLMKRNSLVPFVPTRNVPEFSGFIPSRQ